MPLIMYTQFLDPATSTRAQIITLTIALFGLILGSLLAWVVGGSLLRRLFQSEFGVKLAGEDFWGIAGGSGTVDFASLNTLAPDDSERRGQAQVNTNGMCITCSISQIG